MKQHTTALLATRFLIVTANAGEESNIYDEHWEAFWRRHGYNVQPAGAVLVGISRR